MFKMNGENFKVILAGKPICSKGEPKTDVYILAENLDTNVKSEIKISIKKSNADFIENKIGDERALSIFGQDWQYIIRAAILQLEDDFKSKPLIYKTKKGKTNKGSITLGWKFELLNKQSGVLSNKIALSKKQVMDIYAGTNLQYDKKNALVNGEKIENCGIANYLLFGNIESFNTAQDIINNIIFIEEYIVQHPNIYLACKALNYRTFEKKFDGNRPLCVFINWNIRDNKLTPEIIFDAPLVTRGNSVAEKLIYSLKMLNINTTDDINEENISSLDFVYL